MLFVRVWLSVGARNCFRFSLVVTFPDPEDHDRSQEPRRRLSRSRRCPWPRRRGSWMIVTVGAISLGWHWNRSESSWLQTTTLRHLVSVSRSPTNAPKFANEPRRTGDNAQVTLLHVKSELFVKRIENSATPNSDSWLIQEVMNKRKEGLELNGKKYFNSKANFLVW